uniref:Ig-like domain-containing protein n=1 Tax=Dicentrarchus labrax TaxID=13489 RepID=A0A8C4NX07_DICLA
MKMTGIKCVVFVVVLTFLPSLASEDVEVSCVFMESCILPCSFQGGSDTVIHWIQETAGNTLVHSYYHNQDQLAKQGQRFKKRTSLFKDQISRGNATLQLTGVEVEDQGRYKCYTSINTLNGNKESFINLIVDASISGSDTETTIPCTSANTPLTGFIWRFNHSQIILNQTRTDIPYTVSKEWRQQVKSVSESGSITLQDLSSDREGIYTCELSNEQETIITNTVLRIEKSQ